MISMKHPTYHTGKSLQDNMIGVILYYHHIAIGHLGRKTNIHDHIHETRLCCKRIRSLLRLGRYGMEPEAYDQFNAFYRDNARRLSTIRDLTALSETVDGFRESVRQEGVKRFLSWHKYHLLKERSNIIKSNDFEIIKSEVRDAFLQGIQDIKELRLKDVHAGIMGQGLQKIYLRGQKQLEQNLEQPDDHAMHQWRKQVKYLWYQLVYLDSLWPAIIRPFAMQFRELSKMLGAHHDLVVFQEALNTMKQKGKYLQEIRKVDKNCQLRKKRLEQASLAFGEKLFFIPSHSWGSLMALLIR